MGAPAALVVPQVQGAHYQNVAANGLIGQNAQLNQKRDHLAQGQHGQIAQPNEQGGLPAQPAQPGSTNRQQGLPAQLNLQGGLHAQHARPNPPGIAQGLHGQTLHHGGLPAQHAQPNLQNANNGAVPTVKF